MKGTSLAYLLGLKFGFIEGRYSVTSKLTSIENNIIDNQVKNEGKEDTSIADISNIIEGKILTRGNKITFENKNITLERNIDNPCYIYFSEDSEVNVNFAYFYDSYPLQVTPQHIFFWPSMGKSNFTTKLDTNINLDKSNTAVYCGDLSDILGENAIESERAESIRLGSFPSNKNLKKHKGYFKLVKPVQKDCTVQLHFPPNKIPKKFNFQKEELNHLIHIEKLHNNRSFIMSGFDNISQFEKEQNKDHSNDISNILENKNIWFDLEYEKEENIAYSYNIIAEVMCKNEEGRDIDMSEVIHHNNNNEDKI
jgi:hypothetical protein